MNIFFTKISFQEELINKLSDYQNNEYLLIDNILTENLGIPLLYNTIVNNSSSSKFPKNIIIDISDHLAYLIELIVLYVPYILYTSDNPNIFYNDQKVTLHQQSTIFRNVNFLFEYFDNKV